MRLGRIKWFLDYTSLIPTKKVIFVIRYDCDSRGKILERCEGKYCDVLHRYPSSINLEEAVQQARTLYEIGERTIYVEQFLLNFEGGDCYFDKEDKK